MPGPIVRSGPTPGYQKNWDAAFGNDKADSANSRSTKRVAKPGKKKAAKKKKK